MKNGAPIADEKAPAIDAELAAASSVPLVIGPQLGLFSGIPFTFGERFLADHAGQIVTEPRIAMVELVANAYDAGAGTVKVQWPEKDGDYFEIADDGTGMTADEFTRRWKQFNYNRREEQGEDVLFPKNVKGRGSGRRSVNRERVGTARSASRMNITSKRQRTARNFASKLNGRSNLTNRLISSTKKPPSAARKNTAQRFPAMSGGIALRRKHFKMLSAANSSSIQDSTSQSMA